MSSIFLNSQVVIVLIGILCFIFFYFNSERISAWIKQRTLSKREEILRYFELMFVEVEEKKLTQILFGASFGLGFLFFVALWPHYIPAFLVSAAVTISMWSLPAIFVKQMYEKRCKRLTDQMVDGMTLMSNGIKAGLSVQQCMERVGENMDPPISQEFQLVLSQIRLGRSMSDALAELAVRVPMPEVQMFVLSTQILSETGGNLAETFSTIVDTVRERQKVEKKIEAMTAMGVTQGAIITAVPFVLLIIFYFVDPQYVRPLFTTALGLIALVIMLALQIIGGIMIKKIVTIKV